MRYYLKSFLLATFVLTFFTFNQGLASLSGRQGEPTPHTYIHKQRKIASNRQQPTPAALQQLEAYYQQQKPALFKASTPQPLWKTLTDIEPNKRAQSSLHLELPSNASNAHTSRLQQVEALWNDHQFNEALNQLRALEAEIGTNTLAAGLNWHNSPLQPGLPSVSDTQIGVTTTIRQMCLDFHQDTYNLFAVMIFEDEGHQHISVHISPDNGQSWRETSIYVTAHQINDISAVVLGNFLYVGYTQAVTQTRGKIMRYYVTDGSQDYNFGYQLVIDRNIEIVDVALASNVDTEYDNRLYYFAILSDNSLTAYWCNELVTDWTPIPTNITDAKWGLDITYDEGYQTGLTNYFLLLSYISQSAKVHTVRVSEQSGSVTIENIDLGAGIAHSAVSAYNGVVLTAFREYYSLLTVGITYLISYNSGENWQEGKLAIPELEELYYGPDVTARKGGGLAVIYYKNTTTINPCWFIHRDYTETATWSEPVIVNETKLATPTDIEVEWLPSISGYQDAYGIVWIGGTNDNAYFDYHPVKIGPTYIGVTYPNGGEQWMVGNTYTITWNTDQPIGTVIIELSTNDGNSWLPITPQNGTENDGLFSYKPVSQNISSDCLIRVRWSDNLTVNDQSDATFTIVYPGSKRRYVANEIPAGMSAPTIDGQLNDAVWSVANAEQVLDRGGVPDSYNTPWTNFSDNRVTWKALWSKGTNKIYLAVDVKDDVAGALDHDNDQLYRDETIELFTDGDKSGGYYQNNYSQAQQWLIRKDNEKHLQYKAGKYTGPAIVSQTKAGQNGNWVLELAMNIYDKYDATIHPLKQGDVIGWDVWMDDSDNLIQDGTKWDRDNQVGWGYTGQAYLNADYFQELEMGPPAAAPASITVTSPNGNEQVACDWEITWTSNQTSGNVKLEYQCDGQWNTITENTPDVGKYQWTLAKNTLCSNAKIKITDALNTNLKDESNNFFTIQCQETCIPPYLKVENVSGVVGDILTVEIKMANNPKPIDAFGLKFVYCKNKLTFKEVQAGDLIKHFNFFQGKENPTGLITIGGFDNVPVSVNSSGVFAKIILQVTQCEQGEQCDLKLQELEDDLVGLNICSATFTCESHCLLGDVNMSETITAGDALCAFQIYMNGGVPPAECNNECALYAADANCNGSVTAGDALIIFQEQSCAIRSNPVRVP